VHAGQWLRLPAPYPMPFWLQRVSLLRWVMVTMAQHTFACAAHRCLLDGIPGVRIVYDLIREILTPQTQSGLLFGGLTRGQQIPDRLTARLTLKHPDVALFATHLLMKAR
jgi:hypothetical protein